VTAARLRLRRRAGVALPAPALVTPGGVLPNGHEIHPLRSSLDTLDPRGSGCAHRLSARRVGWKRSCNPLLTR